MRRRAAAAATVAVGLAVGGAVTAIATTGGDLGSRDSGRHSIWSDDVVPTIHTSSSSRRVTLGVRFSSDRAGRVVAVQFYRSRANVGPHKVMVWGEDGSLLGKGRAGRSDGRGWVTVRLEDSVRVEPGVRYVASYRAPHGRFAADPRTLGWGLRAHHRSLTAHKGVYGYGDAMPSQSWRQTNYYVDPVFVPVADGLDAETDSPTNPPSTGFPDAASTGVPSGVTLTPYTGPCTITAANTVIDGALVGCSLKIQAPGVVIRNSLVKGTVANDETSSFGFTIQDSEVDVGDRDGTGIGSANFTVLRVEVRGGNRSINCWRNCTVRNSWVHGQFSDESGVWHESGIRLGSGGTIVRNSIACDAPIIPPDAGCSAGLTGYGDFAVVEDNLVQANLFLGTTGGTCAYGGSSKGKPFSSGVNDVRFIDNVFRAGSSGNCGYWAPIMDFDSGAPGNVWSGNVWEDGGSVTP